MTTNEIEKQLRQSAELKINKHASTVVDGFKDFLQQHCGVTKNGMHWYSKRKKPEQRYDGEEIKDPFVFYDWSELHQLIQRNMTKNFIDRMVQLKAKELLNKMNLFE
tara:strand:+ start:135 stop:455 length:321 start_codon:yes stop_codon:yes gene_type:complete